MIEKGMRILVYCDAADFLFLLTKKPSENNDFVVVGHAARAENIVKLLNLVLPSVVVAQIKEPVDESILAIRELKKIDGTVPVVAVVPDTYNIDEVLKESSADLGVQLPEKVNENNRQSLLETIIHACKNAIIEKVNSRRFAKTSPDASAVDAASISKKLIAIGASTGGTDAIVKVVKDLPVDMPGIVITQHMPVGFTRLFASRLSSVCRMKAKEAQDGDTVQTGMIYIAPGGVQTQVRNSEGSYRLVCKSVEKVNGHCPSVDVLFNSVARAAGNKAVGVILTGMGDDGAKGLLNMKNSGAKTLGQDKGSCVVYGMPEVAFRIGAVDKQLPLDKIGAKLVELAKC